MTDKPKFEVIDRRKAKAEAEERGEVNETPKAVVEPEPEKKNESAGPRLVTSEPAADDGVQLPEPPTAEESREQKTAYDASSERLDDLLRAQNPGMDKQPPIVFESLLQQLYLSAMIAMGAGRRRVSGRV